MLKEGFGGEIIVGIYVILFFFCYLYFFRFNRKKIFSLFYLLNNVNQKKEGFLDIENLFFLNYVYLNSIGMLFL